MNRPSRTSGRLHRAHWLILIVLERSPNLTFS